jgi:hypothetical protein
MTPLAHEAGVRRLIRLLAQDHNILLITGKPTNQQRQAKLCVMDAV